MWYRIAADLVVVIAAAGYAGYLRRHAPGLAARLAPHHSP
jgi:hypothetical protein